MTENEAKRILDGIDEVCGDLPEDGDDVEIALMMAKDALEEIQEFRKQGITIEKALDTMCDLAGAESVIDEYRAIGTVEQLRFMKLACEMNDEVLNSLANSVREKMKYEAIGTLEEFKDLKDAEEQGLLLKLPCKVGTPVYYVQKCICPYSCEKCGAFRWVENCYCDYKGRIFERKFDYSHLNAFGNIIFLTKEEAEQALKNMKNN